MGLGQLCGSKNQNKHASAQQEWTDSYNDISTQFTYEPGKPSSISISPHLDIMSNLQVLDCLLIPKIIVL